MPRIAVITGLKSEIQAVAPAWRDAGCAYFAAGGSAARAEAAARRMAADGARLLLSVGLAGGLDPALPPGAVVLASAVAGPDRSILLTDVAWRRRVAEAMGNAVQAIQAPIAGRDAVIASAEEKAALLRALGTVAVDMESHGVARGAAACGVPFLVLRVIADPAGRVIPGTALAGMAEDGTTRAGPVLVGLLRRPWEIPALARLARDSRVAHARLRGVAALCAGVLGG